MPQPCTLNRDPGAELRWWLQGRERELFSAQSQMVLHPDPTHQCLRVHLVKGYRQVRNHASEGNVMTGISAITENVGEDSYEPGHATCQFFQLLSLRGVRNGILV